MDFEYLLFLQNLRAEAPNFINSLLLFISEFTAGSLPVVIIVVFYWCIDKRTGQRMGLCFAGATMVTQLIKNIACVYRPWKQDARLQIAPEAAATATGYSFPSGHATLAASFYGNLAAYLKKYSKWWILPCVLLTLLTAFARNWLGAHTPQDVLVGMMIALVVLLISDPWAGRCLLMDTTPPYAPHQLYAGECGGCCFASCRKGTLPDWKASLNEP